MKDPKIAIVLSVIAILLSAIALFWIFSSPESKPFSESQVGLIVSGVPHIQTEDGFFPELTIINQSDRQIMFDPIIGDLKCEICRYQYFTFYPSGQSGQFIIPPNSSIQASLNGSLSDYFIQKNGNLNQYVIPRGTRLFTLKYRVEGEPQENFHLLEYRK